MNPVTAVARTAHRRVASRAKTDGKNLKSMDVQIKTNVWRTFANQINTALIQLGVLNVKVNA